MEGDHVPWVDGPGSYQHRRMALAVGRPVIRANRLRQLVGIYKTGRFHRRGNAGMFHWFVRNGLIEHSGYSEAKLTPKGDRAMRTALGEYVDKGRLAEVFPPTTREVPRP